MKGKFDDYALWPLAKKFQNWIVDRSRLYGILKLVCIYQHNAIINFQEEKENALTLLIILIVKSLQIEYIAQIYYYDP